MVRLVVRLGAGLGTLESVSSLVVGCVGGIVSFVGGGFLEQVGEGL